MDVIMRIVNVCKQDTILVMDGIYWSSQSREDPFRDLSSILESKNDQPERV